LITYLEYSLEWAKVGSALSGGEGLPIRLGGGRPPGGALRERVTLKRYFPKPPPRGFSQPKKKPQILGPGRGQPGIPKGGLAPNLILPQTKRGGQKFQNPRLGGGP